MKFYVHCGLIKRTIEADNEDEAVKSVLMEQINAGKAGFGMIVAVSDKGFFEDLLDAGDPNIDKLVKMQPTYIVLKEMGQLDIAADLKDFFESEKANEYISAIQKYLYAEFNDKESIDEIKGKNN